MCYRPHLFPPLLLFTLALSTAAPHPIGAQVEVDVDGTTFTILPAGRFVQDLAQAPVGSTLTYERVIFRGPVRGSSASIDTVRAHIELRDVRFMGSLSFDWIVFAGDVDAHGVEFEKGVSFLTTAFLGSLRVSDGKFDRQAAFKGISVDGAADFENAVFGGLATFIDADFGADLSFSNTEFQSDAFFERLRVAGRAEFVDATFSLGGSFKQSVFEGPASFDGARFFSTASFQDARFGGNLDFDKSRFAGLASFSRADFSGPASFRQAAFLKKAHFDQTHWRGATFFSDGRFRRHGSFANALFEEAAYLDAHFPGQLDLRHTSGPHLDLRPPTTDAAIGLGADTAHVEPRIFMQEARFSSMVIDWPRLSGRLSPADTTAVGEAAINDLASVYAVLRHHLRKQGLDDWATACQVEWLDRKLDELSLTHGEWWALRVLDLTSRYGTQIWRVALFAFCCIVFFGAVYWLARSGISRGGKVVEAGFVDCLHLSASAFIRLGWSGWQVTGLTRGLVLLEGLAGWATWGLFVATIINILVR